jgi:hypothetical protein
LELFETTGHIFGHIQVIAAVVLGNDGFIIIAIFPKSVLGLTDVGDGIFEYVGQCGLWTSYSCGSLCLGTLKEIAEWPIITASVPDWQFTNQQAVYASASLTSSRKPCTGTRFSHRKVQEME